MKRFLAKHSIVTFVAGTALGALTTTAVGQTSLGSAIFPDVPSDAYYNQAVGEMANLGIITGFADGNFRPDEPLTRGQAAVLMKRIRDEIKGISPSSRSSSTRSSRSSSTSTSSSSSDSSSSSIPSAGLIRFTMDEYKFDEDAGTVTITLVRTGGSRGNVTVQYKLVADTAIAGTDFEAQEGSVMFDDGKTSVKFDIKILDDNLQEGDESFKITLSDPTTGAGFTEPSEAIVVIDDDETADSSSSSGTSGTTSPAQGTFKFSATEYSVSEGAGSITVRVARSGGDTGAVAVDYAMANGTADSSNYNKSSGTLNFAAGEKEKTISITVHNQSGITGNKTVNLSLTNPTGGAVLHETEKMAVLTIYDDDVTTFGTGSLKFSDSEYEVTESEGNAVITIRRVGGSKGQVQVKYKSIAGTASNGADYNDVDDVMVFQAGEAAKSFHIKVHKDTNSDGGETVNIRLEDPTNGATLLTPSSATLYIY